MIIFCVHPSDVLSSSQRLRMTQTLYPPKEAH